MPWPIGRALQRPGSSSCSVRPEALHERGGGKEAGIAASRSVTGAWQRPESNSCRFWKSCRSAAEAKEQQLQRRGGCQGSSSNSRSSSSMNDYPTNQKSKYDVIINSVGAGARRKRKAQGGSRAGGSRLPVLRYFAPTPPEPGRSHQCLPPRAATTFPPCLLPAAISERDMPWLKSERCAGSTWAKDRQFVLVWARHKSVAGPPDECYTA